MSTPLRRRLRHLRRLLGYGALVLLILAATAVGVLNQLLPLVERHPERIAAWLSDRIGQPVSFDGASARWTRRGPRLSLEGLRIGSGADTLDIGRAELLVAVYSGVLPGAPLTELKVRELDLRLEQDEDGRWRLAGLPVREGVPAADPLETLEALGELQVERARLSLRSPALASELRLARVDLRLRVSGDSLRAGLRMWASHEGMPLTAVAELRRGDWSGRLWVGGRDLELAQWSPLLADTGVVMAGRGELDLWAVIRAQRVAEVRSRARLEPFAVGARRPWYPDGAGGLRSPAVAYEGLDLLARWRSDADGWQLHAPELRFRERGRERPHALDGLWLAVAGEVSAVRAPSLDLGPVRALAMLSPRLPDELRRWLYEAAPDGELRNLRVAGRQDEWSGSVAVERLQWQAQARRPGMAGLRGSLAFDQDGGVMRARGPVSFDWVAFREPLEADLTGTLAWWREGGRWHLGAAGLELAGADFGAQVRAELEFDGEGRPRMDMAASVAPSDFAAAKRFWVRDRMPPRTVQWLDEALVQGRVSAGRAVLAGDLDQWPFRANSGRFDARAHVSGATVRFHEDWPDAEDLALDLVFDGPGMALVGGGMIAGNGVQRVAGGITDFRDPVLALDIESASRGEALQALMRASPLAARHEEHLRHASLRGPAAVDLTLELPLRRDLGPPRVEGELELAGARFEDPRWQLRLDELGGVVRFSAAGFAADGLKASFEGHPARFSLLVGAATGDAGLAARAALTGVFPAEPLLRRHEPLAWLLPHLRGETAWNLVLEVPAVSGDAQPGPAMLGVESDLTGLALDLPAPLAKPAASALPLRLLIPVPLERGELRLQLGDLLALRSRQQAGQAMAAHLLFGPGEVPAPPAEGLVVSGTAPSLDAAAWVRFAGDGEGTARLRRLDLQVRALDLLGAPFADTRVRLERDLERTLVRLEGEAVDGEISVPAEPSLGIEGRFRRLYWPLREQAGNGPVEPADGPAPGLPAAAPAPGSAQRPADAAVADAAADPDLARIAEAVPLPEPDQDPSTLPALRFGVEDLRVGALVLGRAELQAHPAGDGLRVDRFSTRSDDFSLDAVGDWRRAGEGRAVSEFSVDFKADSLGALLDAFGLAGMVDKGPTTGRLEGWWPGSPGGFSLERFSGRLQVEVGEGALLEVEPGGGGRVLGLISLAEIPRRLSLDFSDFFAKGFGFNTMSGEFVFADGMARTDLLRINGPAAEIRVSGSTDLRRREYDQRIEVLPKAGGVLPAIGALAAGPLGAAVGAVAQAVLHQPLKQAARTVYRVTGPWEAPVVEVVERGPPPVEGDKQ
ncbi:YhdP family protein [Arenimonas fontis]|uniref:TIGR02099 family protein n=1 Tax=Arenimonas fontis TaxID=2608255 RepID=A0A5B2ZE38_9GAMM|nr:YhdP family protein [Arenimonas fontis]KAA2286269.1 TIGR02099 family protein [Arenimonas fontis]